ncbi:hypothetical protein ABB02_02090 [Clostridiaceae bacterium JG1575]|nr:hypothetical protein ABB02_02090 [Clostridiaceae bacterium JG1575]
MNQVIDHRLSLQVSKKYFFLDAFEFMSKADENGIYKLAFKDSIFYPFFPFIGGAIALAAGLLLAYIIKKTIHEFETKR